METREILLKAEKGTLSWERIDGGKIRFKTSSWDDPVVTTRSQVLEIVMVDHLPGHEADRVSRHRNDGSARACETNPTPILLLLRQPDTSTR
jgi:hypothetical protein